MKRAHIWGRDLEMQGSPWTFVVYKRAFGGDLLSDVVDTYKKDSIELVDLLKFAWAMCRTSSDGVPDFEEWCRSFTDFTLADGEAEAVASVIISAINAEIFRRRETRFQRWRRVVRARWLGWLQKRRRAREARLLARRSQEARYD